MRALARTCRWPFACALAPVVLWPELAAAQLVPRVPIAIEVRPMASFPVGDFGRSNPGLGAGAGVGLAAAVHVQVSSSLSVYGGYDYERFRCVECGGLGFQDRLPEAGFEVGLEAVLPIDLGPVAWWLSAGALFGRRLEIPDGGDGFASNTGTGWSAGTGLLVPLGPSLRLRPGIRYRGYSATFVLPDLGFGVLGASGTLERQTRVGSVALEVGLSYEL